MDSRSEMVVAMRVCSSGKVVSSSARTVLGWEKRRTMNHFEMLERFWIW